MPPKDANVARVRMNPKLHRMIDAALAEITLERPELSMDEATYLAVKICRSIWTELDLGTQLQWRGKEAPHA